MIDYTINGLVIGNIYALLAVGLALIFGVSTLASVILRDTFASGVSGDEGN